MKLFYTTEEVASHLGIPVSRLTFYVAEFKLNIKKIGRIRKFTHLNLEKLQKIVNLIDKEGYTIEGAKEKIKAKDVVLDDNKEIIKKLKDIRKTLSIISESIAD
jgi:DNA-binding transcriptional MerR regulator